MDDLRARIKALLNEIEYVHVKKNWAEHLIAAGIDEDTARQWAVEIGEIVAEYERSFRYLVDLLEEEGKENIAESIYGWLDYTRGQSIFIIDNITSYLMEHLEPHRPPPPDNEDV